MTITATQLATNTVQITASGTANPIADMYTAVSNAITGVNPVNADTGWTVWDSFTYGVITTQVFRSLNKDGSTYKFLILRWNFVTMELNTSTCENWVPNTAVLSPSTPLVTPNPGISNEAWTYFDSAPIGFRMDACDLFVMVHPRWCIIEGSILTEYGEWAGVVEFDREDVADTAANAYPCWGWVSSTLWMLGASTVSTKPLGASEYPLLALPRTRSLQVGVNATRGFAADYGATSYPSWTATSVPAFVYQLGNQVNKFAANIWDPTKRLILPIKPIYDFAQSFISNYGAIFGLKVAANSGANMNRIKGTIDADGNFSGSGTLADHWLLNCHHKTVSDANSWGANTSWTSASPVVASGRPEAMVSTGANYYVITTLLGAGTLYKINALTASAGVALTTGSFTDIKFDGDRYVYIGTQTSIIRLDIRDDSMATITIAGGVQSIGINSTHIITAPFSSSASPAITRILRAAAFTTIDTSVTLALTNVYVGDVMKFLDITTDHDGNFWLVGNATTAANFRVVKITQAGLVSSLVPTVAPGIPVTANAVMVDATTLLITLTGSTGSSTVMQYNPRTNTYIAAAGVTPGLAFTPNANFRATTVKVSGVLITYSRPNSVGAYGVAVALGGIAVGSASILTSGVVNTANNANSVTVATQNPFLFWDGCRLITNTDMGLKIYTGVNGSNPTSSVTVGQAVLPA